MSVGRRRVRLGDVLRLRKEIVHPHDKPQGRAIFVGLEHLESGTGRRTGSLEVDLASLTGRKPKFYKGDIVYGYLRPYLNKVWVAEFDGLCSVDQYVYEVDRSQANAEFIAWFMRSPNYLASAPVASGPGQLPRIRLEEVAAVELDLPSLGEQRAIVGGICRQIAVVERARAATEEQLTTIDALRATRVRASFQEGTRRVALRDALVEVTKGVGREWSQYRMVGATRAGLAPAKESVGKNPERYKLVEPGTIFYNPMRILLGSIAFLDEGQEPGITSPDYVVFTTQPGVIHPRWFYHRLRTEEGAAFIRTLARGAVRERMLFRRLAAAEVEVPPFDAQLKFARAVDPIERARAAAEAQLATLEALTASLLRRGFGGV